jgi:holliday junction DNA helicase RuvA
MIAMIRGTLISVDELKHHAIIDVSGVGYDLLLHIRDIAKLSQQINQEICLHSYLHVREDSMDLFGFLNVEEKQCFQDLISVNGVGPKLGMTIMGSAEVSELMQAIQSENKLFFKSMSGVGPKMAQRLILELQSKIKKWQGVSSIDSDSAPPQASQELDDLRSTFANLGYNALLVERALMTCMTDNTFLELPLEEKIRTLLNKLSTGSEKADTL